MSILTAILNTLVVVVCLFLICLILIQRGKGGGLAGAFGGQGGSSAFGTKAGDVFTRVTVVVASVWILLSLILVILYNRNTHKVFSNEAAASAAREILSKSRKSATGAGAGAGAAPGGAEKAPANAPAEPGAAASPVTPAPLPAPAAPAEKAK